MVLFVGRSSVAATEFIIKVNYEIYGLGQQREADFYERGRATFFGEEFLPCTRPHLSVT